MTPKQLIGATMLVVFFATVIIGMMRDCGWKATLIVLGVISTGIAFFLLALHLLLSP